MTTRGLIVIGIALAVIGLALPWQASRLETELAPLYLPGTCITSSYDGSLDCSPGTVGFSTLGSIRPAVMGFGQPIRVFAVIAALLIWRGRLRRSTVVVGCGLAAAAFGVLAAGFSSPSGPAVFLLGLGAIALMLRREGLLLRTPRAVGGKDR